VKAALFVAIAAALLTAGPASAAEVDRHPFRYERPLAPQGGGPVLLEPDGTLYAHTRPGFADLRIVDGDGRQVPWRPLPEEVAPAARAVPVLDSGRRGRDVVALLDLGLRRHVVDQVELELGGSGFVGRVAVSGSDDRRTWTRLSTTTVYDLGGAHPARSTTVVFPRSDYRFLLLRGRNVPRIVGARVAAAPRTPVLRPVPARVRVRETARATVVTLDLGHRGVPVDEVRISAATPRYDRAVEAGDDYGRIVRTGSARVERIPVSTQGRFVRVRIENGDDEPLRGLRVTALARPRTLLVEPGHRGPLTLLYGGRVERPAYDYALLPRADLALAHAGRGVLGAERANPEYSVTDTRTFVARHPALVTAALALAGIAVVAAGVLALRRT
jgi:hypothetical protein